MTTEIRLAETITDDKRRQLFLWGEDIFGVQSYKIEWRPKDFHFFAEEDGKAVAHVGVLRHTIEAVGEDGAAWPVVVGGIGGVVSVPEVRGRGYAQATMRRAAAFMRDDLRVEFGMLFCREPLVEFYGKLGWQRLTVPVEVEQSEGRRVLPFVSMVLPCAGSAWPLAEKGSVNLRSLPW